MIYEYDGANAKRIPHLLHNSRAGTQFGPNRVHLGLILIKSCQAQNLTVEKNNPNMVNRILLHHLSKKS